MTNIEQRAYGKFPISIATCLALEGAFGIHDELPTPPKPPINDYTAIWINVRTVFRNVHGAIERDNLTYLNPQDFAQAMQAEMTVIEQTVDLHTQGRCKVVYYCNTYASLPRLMPDAKARVSTTDKQRFYDALELSSVERCLAMVNATGNTQVILGDVHLNLQLDRVMLITHLPIDLLYSENYRTLVLLESHTGVIKGQYQWHTKLMKGREMPRIPFNRMTIQLYGDTGNMFQPYPLIHRTVMLKIAEKYEWTQRTTKDKILLNIELAREPILRELIGRLF